MNEVTLLKQRISGFAHDAREQGQAEIADRLDDALSECRKNCSKRIRKCRDKKKSDNNQSLLVHVLVHDSTKENREVSPTPPLETKETHTNNACAREVDCPDEPAKSVKPKKPKKDFTPPTLKEIADYIAEKNYTINAELFYKYYVDSEWKVCGRYINWKRKCGVWQKREALAAEREALRQSNNDAKYELRYAKRHAVNSTNAAEAVKACRVTNAILNLTESDWELCAECCANCDGKSCKAGHKLPCDHMLNQRPIHPTGCTHFTKKQESANEND